jgi:putative nucleotidyltransferase with HDIG domain
MPCAPGGKGPIDPMPISQELQYKIEQLPSLPTLPEVASQLIRIINDPDTSARDVSSIVGQDLSLSAKLLRLANSAFYGMPRKINTINTAVVILGFRVVSTLVLSLTVFDIFPQDRKSALFNRRAFWHHSLSCAVMAKFIASRMQRFVLFDPEEAFCAALLHDIGKVVMEQYLHEDFHEALKNARYRRTPLFETEKSVLGYCHTDVAEWLTRHWDLPEKLRAGIIHHHTPGDSSEDGSIAALCHYADFLFYDLKLGPDNGYVPPSLDPLSTGQLKIPADVINELGPGMKNEMEKISVFYSIATG